MVFSIHRALVVDDEPHVQKLVVAALRNYGFQCEAASDGRQAEDLIARSYYDIVVTDLRMPNMHGHALVQRLLERSPRPLIVVHTGVIEPKLAQDLLKRGVDDILFKPINFTFLAAKAMALVERRHMAPSTVPVALQTERTKSNQNDDEGPISAEALALSDRISISQVNSRLRRIESMLPTSNAALEVVAMVCDGNWQTSQLTAAIQRDASLTADVLRLANSSAFNPSSRNVGRLEEAVLRIGVKRVGKMALATSALAALTAKSLPWVDADLIWRRSMAMGIVLEMLIEVGNHQSLEEGLMLSAIMHPMGRVVLGTAFPDHYAKLTEHCVKTGDSLREHERRILPVSDSEAIAQLLENWHIPREAIVPITFLSDDLPSLTRISEPMRTRAELVKLATVLGRLVVGRWQEWDLIELPSSWLLERLGVSDVIALLQHARSDLNKLMSFSPSGIAARSTTQLPRTSQDVCYCTIANQENDLVAELLPTLGFNPISCTTEEILDPHKLMLVNCLGVLPSNFPEVRRSNAVTILADAATEGRFSSLGRTITIPTSAARLKRSLVQNLQDFTRYADIHNRLSKAELATTSF